MPDDGCNDDEGKNNVNDQACPFLIGKGRPKALALSQEDLDREHDISFATVNRWENGQVKPFKLTKAQFDNFCAKMTMQGKLKLFGHGYVLTPGRYLGVAEIEDDGIPFDEKMTELTAKLYEQFAMIDRFGATIRKNLEVLGYGVRS